MKYTLQSLIIFILILIVIYIFFYRVMDSFTICGNKNLNRREIWEKTKNKYGTKEVLNIFPMTYILPKELDIMKKDKNKQFILKTLWSGMRKGVELYDSKERIEKDYKKYNIAQVFIKNPLLINGFKFHTRIYMVTYCGIGNYLYIKGYNNFSKKRFDYNSMDREKKISMVEGKLSHYEENNLPKTTEELEKVIHITNREIIENLATKIKKIINSCKKLCCLQDNKQFHIYGIDIELLDNLDPYVLEINSSPTLNFKQKWKSYIINNMKNDIYNKHFNRKNWVKIK